MRFEPREYCLLPGPPTLAGLISHSSLCATSRDLLSCSSGKSVTLWQGRIGITSPVCGFAGGAAQGQRHKTKTLQRIALISVSLTLLADCTLVLICPHLYRRLAHCYRCESVSHCTFQPLLCPHKEQELFSVPCVRQPTRNVSK